jgi:hypothetical protein
MERRIFNWNYIGILGRGVEKLKHLKGSLAEVYYELSFNNLPCCEMKIMGIKKVLKTFV